MFMGYGFFMSFSSNMLRIPGENESEAHSHPSSTSENDGRTSERWKFNGLKRQKMFWLCYTVFHMCFLPSKYSKHVGWSNKTSLENYRLQLDLTHSPAAW